MGPGLHSTNSTRNRQPGLGPEWNQDQARDIQTGPRNLMVLASHLKGFGFDPQFLQPTLGVLEQGILTSTCTLRAWELL